MADITPEQQAAHTQALADVADALESMAQAAGSGRPTDEQLWERYFNARAGSVFCKTPSEARDWATAALAEFRKKFPA